MSDDLEERLSAALARQAEHGSSGAVPRPAVSTVQATARRRLRRRRLAAGGLGVALVAGVALVRPWPEPGGDQVQVAVGGAGPTSSTAAPVPSTTISMAPSSTVAAAPSFSSPTPVTTPTYQPLAWYDLVDGVQVAWQTDGDVTTTWTRVAGGVPEAVGIERAEPQAHVVPTGARSLVIVIFARPGVAPPTEVTVDADGIAPAWTEVTWDPVASVGWARPTWSSSEPPAQDMAVAQR